MNMKELDCRGQACPQPVLITRSFLVDHKDAEDFRILVDNRAAAENVKRFLENAGFGCVLEEAGTDFLIVSRSGLPEAVPEIRESEKQEGGKRRILVLLTADRIGDGDVVLGAALMKNFILTLKELGDDLWRIVCLNGGVRLAVKESPVLTALKELEEEGVDVLVCGTCLEHYGLTEEKAVGSTTNMLDIVTGCGVADKVISF
ncbi:sulfurtransferase-like selenium metabolism protein YedF [Desulfobotulus mexicanus]|uniref:Sulfurtransferase-like selenium metabolism protein YedF n=1 Tax=Desulfobotulus mexicanus TaxID=2586642 RepID=A0A5S5MDJ6_9BACT|nr:sulfurtransferase-like selenium metabolism protein YedF [Desulfobotulus mexicanus]TYT73749.1 sulfurtransferase-like selenium metabolism protein YedF [Desulfobotulus mexicanus]